MKDETNDKTELDINIAANNFAKYSALPPTQVAQRTAFRNGARWGIAYSEAALKARFEKEPVTFFLVNILRTLTYQQEYELIKALNDRNALIKAEIEAEAHCKTPSPKPKS